MLGVHGPSPPARHSSITCKPLSETSGPSIPSPSVAPAVPSARARAARTIGLRRSTCLLTLVEESLPKRIMSAPPSPRQNKFLHHPQRNQPRALAAACPTPPLWHWHTRATATSTRTGLCKLKALVNSKSNSSLTYLPVRRRVD